MRPHTRKLVLAVAMALAVVGAAPSVAQAPNPVERGVQPDKTVLYSDSRVTIVREGDWVRKKYVDSLPNASKKTIRGERVEAETGPEGGGCRYADSGTVTTLLPGTRNVEREVAHNASACLIDLESAVIGAKAARSAPEGQTTGSESASPAALAGLATSANARAYHKTFFEDPPQRDVSSSRAEVSWSYDGYCVTNSWDHWHRWGWLSFTGWTVEGTSVSADRTCDYATTSAYAKFKNEPFCDVVFGFPMPATFTEHDVTLIQGRWHGGYYWYYSFYKWGGCNDLLNFEHEHGFF